MNKDKDICEKLGICWHEKTDDVTRSGEWCMCTCGYAYIRPENHINTDFTTDTGVVMLLREMMGQEGFGDYLSKLSRINYNQCLGCVIPVELITTPGAFRDKVWEWLCGGGKCQ